MANARSISEYMTFTSYPQFFREALHLSILIKKMKLKKPKLNSKAKISVASRSTSNGAKNLANLIKIPLVEVVMGNNIIGHFSFTLGK